MLPGDVLLVTAFISYVGCFTKHFRLDLLNKLWLPNLKNLEVILVHTYSACWNKAFPIVCEFNTMTFI